MRPILATISYSALNNNLKIVKGHAPKSKVMAVVKANGYGHGLLNVAHGINEADGFAVLSLGEAIDLREAGFQQTILLLEGVFSKTEMAIAASFTLDVVVHSIPQIEMLEAIKFNKPVTVHLKMNTGMNRLGFVPADYLTAYNRLQACKNVSQIVLMTHFATADEDIGIAKPLQLFQETTQGLENARSLANSATILRHPEAHVEWVRPGIMLYGASPVTGTPAVEFGLQPVMSLTSEIICVQTLQAGESVGYGHRFTASKATRVGIVACGYADGFPRHAGQYCVDDDQYGIPIAVNGKLTQTIGRVSMDMLFVDLTEIPEANIGTPVELWGKIVPVDVVAEACGTVGYELLCAVAPRVPFNIEDGEALNG
ncbi:MAG: alanine racemase [Methylotenera sp.]|nr:alanine racemase [Methylotenera sp.]